MMCFLGGDVVGFGKSTNFPSRLNSVNTNGVGLLTTLSVCFALSPICKTLFSSLLSVRRLFSINFGYSVWVDVFNCLGVMCSFESTIEKCPKMSCLFLNSLVFLGGVDVFFPVSLSMLGCFVFLFRIEFSLSCLSVFI
uniref:Uncharacterized protein n=1 Tax=Cacopsylla melanoneura TaxID=428564 RepID=A0A8D8QCQ5_9HEMI